MPTFGLLRNRSNSVQLWGTFSIAPGGIGRVPYEVVEGLRKHPSRDFSIVDDESDDYPFVRTEHEPSSPRYRRLK